MDFTDLVVGTVPHAKIAGAAFAGGVVRLFLRPAPNISQSAFLLASSAICGYFGHPLAIYALGLDQMQSAALFGLVGLSLAEGALKAADKADLVSWFTRKELP